VVDDVDAEIRLVTARAAPTVRVLEDLRSGYAVKMEARTDDAAVDGLITDIDVAVGLARAPPRQPERPPEPRQRQVKVWNVSSEPPDSPRGSRNTEHKVNPN